MKEHKLKSIDLARKLNVSPGLISDITNYKKGVSKAIIRELASLFKLSHEAFNRHYSLIVKPSNPGKSKVKRKRKSVALV